MPLACIYHKTQGMRVVSMDDRERLVASGEWFKHPNCEKFIEVNENEKQIRQLPKQRRVNGEHSSKKTGISAQRE